MELSTRARYTVEAVIDLALNSDIDGNTPLSSISSRVGISISYLEQLFAKLRKAGLVKSIKGSKGGYKLSKDIKNISILDIINAVNEVIETRTCKGNLDKGKGCNVNSTKCYSHNLWDNLLLVIKNQLSNTTLYDVIISNSLHSKQDNFTSYSNLNKNI